jgi:hypothetical protein
MTDFSNAGIECQSLNDEAIHIQIEINSEWLRYYQHGVENSTSSQVERAN